MDAIQDGSELSPVDKRALEIIHKSGARGGILQSELWKILNVDSKEGSKIILRLIRRGLITRREIIHNGRKTYVLSPARQEDAVSISIEIDSAMDVPCFTCEYLFSECGASAKLNPASCSKMSGFLKSLRESPG